MTQPTRLYRFMSLLTIPVVAVALLLIADLALHPLELDFGLQPFWSRWLYGFIFPVVNIVIGLLCMRRAPGNVIGPLLVLYGAGLTAQSLRASFDPVLGALIFVVGAFLGWVGFFVLVLLFPNGKPHPRWMRWYLLALLVIVGCYGLLFPLGSPHFNYGADDAPTRLVDNPLFIPTAAPILDAYFGIMFGAFPAVIVFLPLSVFLRYRAAASRERAQIRWILWGVLVFGLMAVAQRIFDGLGMAALGNAIGASSTFLVFTLPAFAVGNAILRYRLYDIDIIIRRTLVYSVLTGILAIIYFGGVILVQQIFRAATGESSDLAIVISTLLIAALFSPLRRRVQNTIDRRFFRRKYDAEQTLARFNQTLRDEVDLDTLKANLIGVVSDTMQPTKVALWVREE